MRRPQSPSFKSHNYYEPLSELPPDENIENSEKQSFSTASTRDTEKSDKPENNFSAFQSLNISRTTPKSEKPLRTHRSRHLSSWTQEPVEITLRNHSFDSTTSKDKRRRTLTSYAPLTEN